MIFSLRTMTLIPARPKTAQRHLRPARGPKLAELRSGFARESCCGTSSLPGIVPAESEKARKMKRRNAEQGQKDRRTERQRNTAVSDRRTPRESHWERPVAYSKAAFVTLRRRHRELRNHQKGFEMSEGGKRKASDAPPRRKRKKLSPEDQMCPCPAVRGSERPGGFGEVLGGQRCADSAGGEDLRRVAGALVRRLSCGSDVDSIDDNLAAEAVRIFRDAEKCGISLSESMVTSLLRACCHLDDIQEARRIVQSMTEKGVSLKARSLRPLLHYSARKGLAEECLEMLREMQRRGFEVTELDYAFAFRGCVHAGPKARDCFLKIFQVERNKAVSCRLSGTQHSELS
eukprot:scaffold466_cov238-Pinguiococcus_pyrenoidosus.AAC.4